MLAIVGGMPRGGTTYAARALNACGIPAEHERAFSGDPEYLNPSSAPVQVGWLGVAWFYRFRGRRILLARPPLNVIRSLDSRGWFSDDHPGKTIRKWLERKTDRVFEFTAPRKMMAAFYLEWMSVGLASCDEVWRLTDIDREDLLSLGQIVDADTDITGLDEVPTNTNTGSDDWRERDWGQEVGHLWPPLESMAERLGVPMGYGDLERV